jgi:hypothetical protein
MDESEMLVIAKQPQLAIGELPGAVRQWRQSEESHPKQPEKTAWLSFLADHPELTRDEKAEQGGGDVHPAS